jgi:hypothetical protein
MKPIDFYSPDPMDYVRVALAIETLSYHNRNFLSTAIIDNDKHSEQIQWLLTEAIRKSKTMASEATDGKLEF